MPEAAKTSLSDKFLAKVFLPLIPKQIKPNHISAFRIVMTPLVAWFFWRESYFWGGVLFLAAALTDALDGALARTRLEISHFGKMLDPLADKILICTVAYILVLKYIDVYTAYVVIGLEIIIILTAVLKYRNGNHGLQANSYGKVKMVLQVLGVMALLLSIIFNIESLLPISKGTIYLAMVFGILSLFSSSI